MDRGYHIVINNNLDNTLTDTSYSLLYCGLQNLLEGRSNNKYLHKLRVFHRVELFPTIVTSVLISNVRGSHSVSVCELVYQVRECVYIDIEQISHSQWCILTPLMYKQTAICLGSHR